MHVHNYFTLVLLLALSSIVWADTKSTQRLENVQTEIQTLSKDLKQSKTTKTALYKQLKQQSQTISKLNRELHHLDKQLQQQATQLQTLKQQQQRQQLSHGQQLQALYDQLRAAYINVQPNYLKVLLSQHDPASLSRTDVYFRYFHQARQQQLTTISETLQSLTNSQQQILQAQQRYQQLFERTQHQQQALQKTNKQRLATLKKLDVKMNAQGVRLTTLQEEEQSLQALLRSLSQKKSVPHSPKNSPSSAFATRRGSLDWPIQGKVIARYGSSRNLGKLTWQGIMIQAAPGKEVIAAAEGRVVFSDWLRGFGLLLILDHGNQYMTLYGNNQTLLKEVGDTVNAGEAIALSGDQGIRKYAGLYFEIRHKGNPTNPVKWLGKQS